MDLTYKRRFTESKIPEAYEALILDALRGDHSNFVRHDELDVAWKACSFLSLLRYHILLCEDVNWVVHDSQANLIAQNRFSLLFFTG